MRRSPAQLLFSRGAECKGREGGTAAKTSESGRPANVAKVRHESFCDASCAVAARYEGWHGAGGAALGTDARTPRVASRATRTNRGNSDTIGTQSRPQNRWTPHPQVLTNRPIL